MVNKDIDNPAAWLIMNSISNLHNVGSLAFTALSFIASILPLICLQFYLNQDLAFTQAELYVAGTVDKFVETFCPLQTPHSSPVLSVLSIIAMVRLGLAVVGASVWGGMFGALPAVLATSFSKDAIKGVVQGVLRLTGTFFSQPNNE